MRILHVSDVHLGIENYGGIDGETGLPSRYADVLRSLDVVVDQAEEEHVDAVLFSGDAFKTRDPTPTQQKLFAERIVRLAARCPVVLLVGNHDMPTSIARADALSIFDTLHVPNVTVLRRIQTIQIETASGPLNIVGVPWILRSHFLTLEQYRNLSLEEVNRLLAETVAELVTRQLDALDPTIPAVLTVHGSVTGALFGSERSIMLGSDVPLPLGSLVHPHVQYVALGHIHKHQVLHEEPPVVYAGSIERIDFGEELEPKGFVIADIAIGKPTRWRHVETPARVFHTIDVRIPDDALDPNPLILSVIEESDITDAVVRVRVDLPGHLRILVDDAAIRSALKAASYVAGVEKIQRLSPLVTRPDLVALERTPLEALAEYLTAKGVDAARREQLLKLAEIVSAEEQNDERGEPAAPSA